VSNLTRGLTKNAKSYEKSKVESEVGSPGRIRTSDQPVNSQPRRGNFVPRRSKGTCRARLAATARSGRLRPRLWPETFDRLRPQVLKRVYPEALVVNL
jgi:hypothetical protein